MVAKRHVFVDINYITSTSIKFWPISDQTSFYPYNTAQAIYNYLQTLCKYVYTTTFTLSFPQHVVSYYQQKKVQKYISFGNYWLYYCTHSWIQKDQIYLQQIFCVSKCTCVNVYRCINGCTMCYNLLIIWWMSLQTILKINILFHPPYPKNINLSV